MIRINNNKDEKREKATFEANIAIKSQNYCNIMFIISYLKWTLGAFVSNGLDRKNDNKIKERTIEIENNSTDESL